MSKYVLQRRDDKQFFRTTYNGQLFWTRQVIIAEMYDSAVQAAIDAARLNIAHIVNVEFQESHLHTQVHSS